MQIDQKMLNRLLSMDDKHFVELIRSVATEAGIDPSQIMLDSKGIADIRHALSVASNQDLQQISDIYRAYRQNQKKP